MNIEKTDVCVPYIEAEAVSWQASEAAIKLSSLQNSNIT
jgi:hypothetical protein